MNGMSAAPSEISRASPPELPEAWMERLFRRMEDRYGSLWADRYGAFPRARVQRSWAQDLADMTPGELKRGMDACRDAKYPPTLPEFRQLCRPPVNPEAAYAEAIKQLHLRKDGRDTWSHPAIFWAAQAIGDFDMTNQSWSAIKTRWVKTLNDFLVEQALPAVPAFMAQLPAPGKTGIAPEEAKRRIGEAASGIKPARDTKAWARKIMQDPKLWPDISRRYATEALGMTA